MATAELTTPRVDWTRIATFAAVFLGAVLAAVSGMAAGEGSKSALVLPVAIGAGLILGVLALTRFQIYVMVMLVARSSLDLAKLSQRTAGTTSVGASSRALDPSSILAVLFLLAAAVWLAAQYRHQGSLPGSPLRRALVLFLAAGAVSVIGSGNITCSALVATALGLFVIGMVQSKKLLAGLLIAGLAGLVMVPSLSGRFSDLTQYQQKQLAQTGGSNGGNTLAWRLSYWTQVLPLANSNPITGIGLNQTKANTAQAKQPHNDFIRAYVETGLVGLGAYVAVLVSLVMLGWRAIKRTKKGTFEQGVGAGFLGCAVAFIAVSLVANVTSNVVNLWYFIAFAACASAIVKIADRRGAMAALPGPGHI